MQRHMHVAGFLGKGQQHVELVGEVLIERPSGDTGLGSNLFNGGRLISRRCEHGRRGVEQPSHGLFSLGTKPDEAIIGLRKLRCVLGDRALNGQLACGIVESVVFVRRREQKTLERLR